MAAYEPASVEAKTVEWKRKAKPSEILTAFSTAKTQAAKHATSRIVELVNAEDHTARVSSSVPLHQPLFEPSPAEVWIDEYTPFQPLTVKLRFRNCDTVVRRLKIEPPRSPVFRVRPWETTGKDKVDDYSLDLVCSTERERFLLPVRVRGRFAALDLPDELELGICPVKMPTTRVLTVRNVGTRGSSFAFQTSEHFRVTPPSALLAQGAAVQIELSLVPPNLESGQGELEVKDDSGQTAVVQLAGRVVNVDVFLSQPLVEPNATYLSLSSRKTIKICNESESTLEFSWKSFADFVQEEEERTHILEELSRMEAAEHEHLHLQLEEVEEVDAGFTQSPFDVRKTLETKYMHLRKATLDDCMQFVDACFSITPLTGRVWAHSEVDVVVCFTPEVAHLYSCCAFLEIAGQAARLPLQIRGQGIGPKAKVVYNELLDFGDVFINDERTRDFTIQNKGEIPAEFELIPLTMPSDTILNVYPSSGTLAVNAMLKIEVTFCSQELGEAFHHIRFSMQGSDEQLTVRFKANVIPPVFHFDLDQVDFGAVSYSFPQTRTVKLINASKIAMKYSLRVPEEASYKQKEMELVPSDGKLDAYGEQQITIHFTSHTVKVYQYQLVVGVTGVGADLLSVPLRAQCFVPELSVLQQELDFGRCFLRYPHKQMLVLENKSPHLFGRFEIGEQDDHSRAIATYSASEFSGKVCPGERVSVEISLSCEKLGSIRLPMVVTVPGSTDLPLSVTLSASGSGPKVELDQPEINWGNCTCLVDHERILRMTNVSLVPAAYKTFIRSARSKFQIDRKEGVLMAGESLEFVLVANLDDTIVFKDQLHILITEGDNLVVPLSIRGTGTTMWSPSELRVIDFSHQMTSKECEWSCTLENKGKRVQVLNWVNKTAAIANSKVNSFDQGACIFVFKGLSSTAGFIQEDLVCETRVGKEKVNRVAFVTAVRANFVNPTLTPSSSLLSFEYIHHPGNQILTQSQPLSLMNACELPLSFTLRTQTPFALDCWEAVLQPGEKVDLNVEFYPGFKDDYTCRVINGKVFVSYTGHPQKDSVDLLGDISFPNLAFETTKIDFGCTLNDTQKSISMNVTNVSKVDTRFRWVFIEDEKEALSTATAKKPYIPINQVFDILPIRGMLRPNESEKIEFVFYGHANRKFKSTVACEVEGGPEYELTLSGEASSLVYKLDKQSLDFGQVFYNKTEDRDFSILNVGKVPFSFSILIDSIACGRTLEISPTSGKIAPNEKQRILVRLRPGIPEYFEETVVLEIAHFQPIPFKLFGMGTFAAVSLNLPRENHPASAVRGEAPKWKELKKRAKQNIQLAMLNPASLEGKPNHVSGALAQSDSKSTLSTTFHSKSKKKIGTEVFPFILSQFVLDFGNVVVGTHKIKRFSVTNIGHGPASFQLDKNLASSRGFQIEPERVVRLPEKQSVDFTVTFHSRKNIEMGLHMAQLPVAIKNGPPCIAMVRALVTVPDISISTESLDFGKIALQNVSAVPAEWAFKKPMGSTKDLVEIRNDSDYAVEVFSLDFDSSYQEDEALLRSLTAFTTEDTLQLPNEEVVSSEVTSSDMQIPIAEFYSTPRKGMDYIVTKLGASAVVAVSLSRDRLTPNSSGDIGNNDVEGVVTGLGENERVGASDTGESSNLLEEGIALQDMVAEVARSLSGEVVKPTTFAEYAQTLENTKLRLALFMIRDGVESFVRELESSHLPIPAAAKFQLVRRPPESLGFEIAGVRREFTLFGRGMCGVPTINSDPRNVFMHRVKSRPEGGFVQKKFVISRNQFEFGPLIIANQAVKPPETEREFTEWQKTSPNNVEVFRMSNSKGDTKEVKVWANPSEHGLHENALICCVGDNPEPIPFQIFPLEGAIKPLQKVPVIVAFSASTEAVHELPLRIEFSDAESALQMENRNRTLELILRGEAYKIDKLLGMRVRVPLPEMAVWILASFGLERAMRALLTSETEPSVMILEPGQSSSVNVVFTSKSEVTLRDCRDIKCTIIEMLSGEACREFHVHTSARSVFSKFRLQPNRGVNFGPHKYSDQAQTKRIEIRNDGEFQFKFTVQAFAPATAREKQDTLMIDTPLSPSTLTLGQFAISPDCGTIDPGVTMGLNCGRSLPSSTDSAKVDESPSQSNVVDKLLEFEMRGEGTMPCVTVTEPTGRDSTGALVLDFGRVRTSKAKDMRLSLRNDGILSATVLFSIQVNPNFLFALGNGSVVVPPKATETLTLQFRPQKVHDEPTASQLKITVQNNPFEETTFKLFGAGYREDLVFEDLPRGYDDELHFDDIRLPEASTKDDANEALVPPNESAFVVKDTKVFSLCNQSSDIAQRISYKMRYDINYFQENIYAAGGDDVQVFTIKFSPMEVDEYYYWLCFDIPDAQGSQVTAVKVDVRGGSLRPACHFDVDRSDYAQWRAPSLVGPHGELGPLDPSVKVIEMESLGVREMFWYFKIPHFQVTQLFLFVGTTTEPRVALDRGSVNFNTLLIGTKTSQ
uniref:Abnormal spindle-like microcephaly-associated protein ASH domain-containing protein n=1 Tax=Phytophthora ramorum TaxID=164328 RepID=H3HD69_PHYRM